MKGSLLTAKRVVLSVACLGLCLGGSLSAGSQAEHDFWAAPEKKTEARRSGIAAFPGESWVEAGLFAYGNHGGSQDDHWTGALRIEASFRDTYEFLQFRLNALLGVDSVAEAAAEAQLVLMEGLKLGVGGNYTERAEFTPRVGLYVEDKNEPRRRGGFYLLGEDGGGIELSWPLVEQWSLWGELGEEEDDRGSRYHRNIIGVNYTF